MRTFSQFLSVSFAILGAFSSHSLQAAELIWKRAPVLEQDISRALDLMPEELCRELGEYSCLQDVHLYALGAHDPYARVQYRSLPAPTQLTTIAFERVILSACINRIEKDKLKAEVFRFFPLDQKLKQVDQEAIQKQIRDLYRRFLSRDPEAKEEELLLALADRQRFGEMRADAISQALCLAVGSQLEFLFF